MRRTVTKWKGLNFTGDTNCGINWQAGFDTCACPGDPNTLLTERELSKERESHLNVSGLIGVVAGPIVGGLALLKGKDSADKAYQNALAGVRKLFPGPGVCVTGAESLAVYKGNAVWGSSACGDTCSYITNSIQYMRAAVSDWHQPRNEQNYVAAYNQVITEYSDYYNAHCIAPDNSGGSSSSSSGGSASTPPAGSTAGSGGAGGTTTGGGGALAAAAASTSNNGATQPNLNGKPLVETMKKIPLWALLVGGGLLATIIVVAVVKK